MPQFEQLTDYLYLFPSNVDISPRGEVSLQWQGDGGAFGHRLPLRQNDSVATIQWQPGALSPEECRMVIEMGEGLPRTDGRVELGADTYRVSHISWITPDEQNSWLFHKLAVLFAQANRAFGFELTGFIDALQYTTYGSGQHFDWHLDIGADRSSARKLSMSLQLSMADEYSGGSLEFACVTAGDEVRQLGSATFFPSYLAHRVSPVEVGMRRSLVAWAYGPAFR